MKIESFLLGFLLLITLEVENPAGIGIEALVEQMFIKIANFSDSERRLQLAGTSANCCGVRVRNLIFIIASLTVG
jgi:hypothetical protein